MHISPINSQTNFKGRFAIDFNTVIALQKVDKDPYCERADVKKNIVKLKSFYPDDVYTLDIKKRKFNGKDYDYLTIRNKRTEKEMAASVDSNGGFAGAFQTLTSTLLNLSSEEAVDFVSGKPDIVDLAISDKNFKEPRYYGN